MTQKSVFGIASESQVTDIVKNLTAAGFNRDDIATLPPDGHGVDEFGYEQHTKAPEGAVVGGIAGLASGGVVGWLAGIGTLALPGLGPFIAAGPLMAALGGAALGAAVGGAIGALAGARRPEFEVRRYDSKLPSRSVLLSVRCANGEAVRTSREIFSKAGAHNVAAVPESAVKAAAETQSA